MLVVLAALAVLPAAARAARRSPSTTAGLTRTPAPTRRHRGPRRRRLVHRGRRPRRSGASRPTARSPSSAGSRRASPLGITAGPDGNVWFTETAAAGAIGRITPAGVDHRVHRAASPTGAARRTSPPAPTATSGSPRRRGDAIGRITPAGRHHRVHDRPRPPNASPSGITAGPDGNLWFTEKATAAGSAGSRPRGVDHRVHRRLTRERQPHGDHRRAPTATSGSPSSGPARSAASPRPGDDHRVHAPASRRRPRPTASPPGPDGNLWFTEQRRHGIGRITPAGAITEFTAGITADSAPDRHRRRARRQPVVHRERQPGPDRAADRDGGGEPFAPAAPPPAMSDLPGADASAAGAAATGAPRRSSATPSS